MNCLLKYPLVFVALLFSFSLSAAGISGAKEKAPGPTATAGKYVWKKRNSDCFGVPRWDAATAYTGGQKVTYQNKLYRAVYWNQGQIPPNNLYPAGAWVLLGDC